MAARREGRIRTIFYSVVAAGLVSLTIGWMIERQAYNEQAERSVKSCELTADISRILHEVSLDIANRADDPDVRKRWNGYAVIFQNAAPPRAPTCKAVFPKRAPLPFIK